MSGPQIVVLDVGHGNCTVITDGKDATVVDAGSGSTLMEFLYQQQIFAIDAIILSHSDKDHIGGIVAILASKRFTVGSIHLNSDSVKESKAWLNLVFEIESLEDSNMLVVNGSLCKGHRVASKVSGVSLYVLSPRRSMALRGPGSTVSSGAPVTPNTMSIVLMVEYQGKPIILLPGDMDAVAFRQLLETGQSLRADYLVLPHHGGRWGPGKRMAEMAAELCELVSPKEVLVSNGRGKFNNPRPEIINSVRLAAPEAHVSCTQLSETCCPSPPPPNTGVNSAVHSSGTAKGQCCAGSVVFDLENVPIRDHSSHDAFIDNFSSTALCRMLQPGA